MEKIQSSIVTVVPDGDSHGGNFTGVLVSRHNRCVTGLFERTVSPIDIYK